jgi:hypothetical protein
MKKKVKVLMLPTEKALVIGETSLITSHNPLTGDRLDYGFTSDEEIKEGDWFIDNNQLIQAISARIAEVSNRKYIKAKKVIATTDRWIGGTTSELECAKHKIATKPFNSCTCFIENSLPKIPESFIKAYVEANGEIDEVMVEYEEEASYAYSGDTRYVIKTADDNTVIIHSV